MAHRSAPSPDRKVAARRRDEWRQWLPCRLVPVDGSSRADLVSPPDGQCTSAAWSPTGAGCTSRRTPAAPSHVWRQRYPDGAPEQITFGPTEQEGTAITSDGKYLITSMGLQQASIWLHDANGDRKLTDERYVTQPTLAPLRHADVLPGEDHSSRAVRPAESSGRWI